MKLQACPSCQAQFDVSAFAKGQQFRCGACGALMTAHAGAPGAAPAAPPPGRSPAAPAASSVGAARSPRGPQFKPAQRAQEPTQPAPAAPQRASRAERDERAGRGAAPARKGPPMALVGGGAALVVVIVVVALMAGGGKDKPQGTSAGGPPAPAPVVEAPKDSLVQVKADMQKSPADTRKGKDWKGFIARLKDLGEPAKATLLATYEQYVETAYGSDDKEARAALGYEEFRHPLPEEISQTKGRPFIAAFEAANAQRWLKDEEDRRLAAEALREVQEHARKLREDRLYRAGDDIWNNILQDKLFKDQNFAVRWSPPHLICYASKDRLSDLDLLGMPRSERKKERERLAAKRAEFEPLMDEKQAIYTQLYEEWNRRFKQALGLNDLSDEWGGRPDLVAAKKASYQGGVPLVVWIFEDKDAFNKFHEVKGMKLPDGVGGYFEWKTAWIYLFDERNEGDARVFEIAKNLHEGTHQLEHWFGMQINGWRPKKNFTQDWWGEGLAEYFGSHKLSEDGKLSFTGRNYTRLREAQGMAAALKKMGKDYPVVKLEDLTSWTTYADAMQHAGRMGLDPGWGQQMFIYQQGAWLFEMCMDQLGGKYRDSLMAYLKAVMNREEGARAFRAAFKVSADDPDSWAGLQKDFEDYCKKMLVLDTSALAYKPVKRPAPARKG